MISVWIATYLAPNRMFRWLGGSGCQAKSVGFRPANYLNLLHGIRRLTARKESINFNYEQGPKSTQILKRGRKHVQGSMSNLTFKTGIFIYDVESDDEDDEIL